MIVLDASVLIGFLDGEDVHHRAAEGLLTEAIDDLGANPLTLAEVLVVPIRDGRPEPVQEALRALGVSELPFSADTALRLAYWRARTGLRMPDCCVLLAAEDAGATVATFDERLAETAARHDLPVLPH